MNVAKFTKEHTCLCVSTLGIAIIGYLGYHAIQWMIKKCSKTEKVDFVANNALTNLSNLPNNPSVVHTITQKKEQGPVKPINENLEKAQPSREDISVGEILKYLNLYGIDPMSTKEEYMNQYLIVFKDLQSRKYFSEKGLNFSDYFSKSICQSAFEKYEIVGKKFSDGEFSKDDLNKYLENFFVVTH